MEFRKLSKNALKCMYVKSLISTVIWLAILVGIFIFSNDLEQVWVKVVICLFAVYILVTGIIKPYYKHKHYNYRITEDYIEIMKGFITRERIVVPLERLHKIEVTEGVIQKLYKVADIKVVSGGGDVDMEYIDTKLANDIATALGKRINQIVINNREKAL